MILQKEYTFEKNHSNFLKNIKFTTLRLYILVYIT